MDSHSRVTLSCRTSTDVCATLIGHREPHDVPLMERLMARFSDEHVAVSLPSLRAGTLTPQLMELVKKLFGDTTGFSLLHLQRQLPPHFY